MTEERKVCFLYDAEKIAKHQKIKTFNEYFFKKNLHPRICPLVFKMEEEKEGEGEEEGGRERQRERERERETEASM